MMANAPPRSWSWASYDPAIDLVLLHGFAASNFTWRNVVGPLSQDHRVVALERGWIPVEEAAQQTVEGIVAAGLANPILIGHSAGAEIAAVIASRRMFPTGGLVLEAPVIGVGAPPLVTSFARLPGLHLVAPATLRAMVRVGFPRALRSMWSNEATLTDDVIHGYREPLLSSGALESMWSLARDQTPVEVDWSSLSDIPCMVIRGDRDRWTTPTPHPNARQVVYERCGHLPHEELPDRFIADVERFLLGAR